MLAVSSGAWAQGLGVVPTTVAVVTEKEWARLRTLMASLVTEEGTRKAFGTYPGLGEAFTSEDQFSYFVAPWRSRLSVLPATRQEAPDVEVELFPKSDGTMTCMMTYHHQQPANAITIVKTVWQSDNLMKVVFMKGFSQIPDDNAARNRLFRSQDEYNRQWSRPAPTRR